MPVNKAIVLTEIFTFCAPFFKIYVSVFGQCDSVLGFVFCFLFFISVFLIFCFHF